MNIIILPSAKKDLKKFPKQIISHTLKKIYSIKEDPLRYIERLKSTHLWKLRVGDYRVILYVDTGAQTINVLKIGHRKEVYKRL